MTRKKPQIFPGDTKLPVLIYVKDYSQRKGVMTGWKLFVENRTGHNLYLY